MRFLGERYGIVREWIKAFSRDGGWRPTRNQFIEKFNVCECCGTESDLNVHHIFPVRWYPEFELEPYNLITLCRRHHFYYGHLNDWKKWNKYIWQVAQITKKGYNSFQSIYPTFKIEGKEPDYKETLRFLKRSSGKVIKIKGKGNDAR